MLPFPMKYGLIIFNKDSFLMGKSIFLRSPCCAKIFSGYWALVNFLRRLYLETHVRPTRYKKSFVDFAMIAARLISAGILLSFSAA
jgi:hypothetical protein